MPRTTHPRPRHRHGRAHLRFHTDRIVARRLRSVRHQADDQAGGGTLEIGIAPVRLEDYLRARASDLDGVGLFHPIHLCPYTWRRLRTAADARPDLGYGHDCGWSGDWCDVCKPPRARQRRALEREVGGLIAGGWREELGREADGSSTRQ